MGPQLYRCGNTYRVSLVEPAIVGLQWGRNFIVAEIQGCKVDIIKHEMLQWGRNFIVAEIHFAKTPDMMRLLRFNGAATLSLRKFDWT